LGGFGFVHGRAVGLGLLFFVGVGATF